MDVLPRKVPRLQGGIRDALKTAAITAVMHHIKTEEEAAAGQEATAPAGPPKMWAINGRQTQMQIRHLMNMKAFHGLKFR